MTEPEQRSLGCARCGDCCERIKITLGSPGFTAILSTSGGVAVLRPQGKSLHGGRHRIAYAAGDYVRDAAFIRRWMEPTGDVETSRWTNDDGTPGAVIRQVWRCLKFDPVERECTAHDERPAMCSGYPWYENEPGPNRINPDETRCSFWLDVKPEDRPEGVRPLIPLEVL